MDQLPKNEKQKRIEIRKFFVPDEISERQMIPKLCDQNIFIEEPTATATATATATVTMSEAEIENIVNEPAGTKRKADNVISDDGNTKKMKEIQDFIIGLAAADWSGIVGIPDESLPYTPVITDIMPDTVLAATGTTDSTVIKEPVPDTVLAATVTTGSTVNRDTVPDTVLAATVTTDSGVNRDTVPDTVFAATVTTVSTVVIDAVPDATLVTVTADLIAPMPATATSVGMVPAVHPARSRKDRRATGPAPVKGCDPTKFYCDQCSKCFKRKKDLGEHKLKRCGKVDKEFCCGLCSKEFYSQETLQDHMGKLHYQFKWHICQKCTKGFYS